MHILTTLTFLALSVLGISQAIDTGTTPPKHGTVIGIDLGTTYSCVAIYKGGRVDIIPNDQGNRITPSWVAFNGNERLVGDIAKHMFHVIPSQTVFDVKRLLGRRFDDEELQEDIRHWPVDIVNNYGKPAVKVHFQGRSRTFTPQEISAMVLAKMKETAEAYLGHDITHAVITVPAYFNDEQRQATKDAGQIAGLNVLRILNEPTAAALAYGLDNSNDAGSITIVYDLGGGTFDVSLLRVNRGVFEVLATAGITRLGGEDFDNRIIDYFVAKYQKETATNITRNKRAMSKLKREVERAKRTLSSSVTARLQIESFEGGNDFTDILTRAKFEELNINLFMRTLEPVSRVLLDAKLSSSQVDNIVLVGGSTRIPRIRELLKGYFGGKEPQMGVNPDEAVAYGAAIQGSILSGDQNQGETLLLVDVCPFTLGVATSGGIFNKLIDRNTPIPVTKSEMFSTATDNQQAVLIQVYQGESTFTRDNTLLGTFKLAGIPSAARGVPQIEVTFGFDANGILTVAASNKESGNAESISITSETSRLDQSELDRMTREARSLASYDKVAEKRSEALNQLQQLIATKRMDVVQQPGRYLPPEQARILSLLNSYSLWAEGDGSSASLNELESRINEFKQKTEEQSLDNLNLLGVVPMPIPFDTNAVAHPQSQLGWSDPNTPNIPNSLVLIGA